jgi:hypothetical protein
VAGNKAKDVVEVVENTTICGIERLTKSLSISDHQEDGSFKNWALNAFFQKRKTLEKRWR